MSSTAIESADAQPQQPESEPRKALFVIPTVAMCRVFQGVLIALVAAGHRVLVALDPVPGGLSGDDVAYLDGLRQEHSTFSYRALPGRVSLWRIPANAIRRSLAYISYRNGDYGKRDPRREDARFHVPWVTRALLALPPFRWASGRRFVAWVLRRLEAGMPVPHQVRGFISEETPNLVLVSPLVDVGSNQGDYLRAAQAARIPSIFIVAGDGDLSAKGVVRDPPTFTVAWSRRQADDAVHLQGLPPDRVIAVVADDAGNAPAPPAVQVVVERITPEETVGRREGRILRPLLLLLTPLLVVLLPIFRPRRSAQAAIRIIRQWPDRRRKRKANRARRRDRDRKARAEADRRARAQARDQKRAGVEAARAEKAQRDEAKQRERARAVAAKQDKIARRTKAQSDGAETEQPTADGEPAAPQPQPTKRTRGPVGERERDLGQAAPASGEGTGADREGPEGTDAGGQGGAGAGAEGGKGSG